MGFYLPSKVMEEVELSKALIETRLLHERYQMSLPPWHQFVIWSYTLGSGAVNAFLLGTLDNSALQLWCARISKTFRDLSRKQKYELPPAFRAYQKFLLGSAPWSLPEQKKFIGLYARNLQQIIQKAPPLTGEIVVHKASTPYPGLTVGDVKQEPFNSTSYRIDTNYSIFLPPGGLCCMHRITLRKGARVLILSPLLSAYPDEAEVLLPFGVTFRVAFVSSMALQVPVTLTSATYKKVQSEPLSIGPVFFYNYKTDCQTVKKDIRLYNSVLIQ